MSAGAPVGTRGGHLLDAAVAVVADAGLTGLSVRAVAARACVSPAQVQYYFPTRADLVAGAFESAGDQFLATLAPLLERPASVERLRAVVDRWLPLDTARAARARVWVAFAEAAAGDRDLATAARGVDAESRAWFAEELGRLQELGRVRAEVDPGTAGATLLALLDGVTVQALALPVRRRAAFARSVLDPYLGSLLT